ncbi:hypothetical protein C9374_012841 [Naegleria lovaniensis]|uniref:Uncharacterized protein n=1 Tax=Naegleria lovaniensis TaxID=51637 RepID=A0AA88GEG1_NAELO|nr:uncharacterized protein C9374_012841 [Naegleria lovaniensis]KAG2373109.1 hypothetical protein C9374_012841 [Naegleria lovaniensis]
MMKGPTSSSSFLMSLNLRNFWGTTATNSLKFVSPTQQRAYRIWMNNSMKNKSSNFLMSIMMIHPEQKNSLFALSNINESSLSYHTFHGNMNSVENNDASASQGIQQQQQHSIKTISEHMKQVLQSSQSKSESVWPNYAKEINSIFSHFEKFELSEALQQLTNLNEALFRQDSNLFSEEMQAVRMVYLYISFLDQIYSKKDGEHDLPLFNEFLDPRCFEFDYFKHEVAVDILQKYITEHVEKINEGKTPEFVTLKRKLAWVKFYQNHLLSAINDVKEALAVARVVFGKTSVEACYCYSDLASLYVAADNLSASEKCAKIVISLLPQKPNKTPYLEEKIAMAMVALSESVRESNAEECVKLNTSAIKIIENVYGRRNKKWIDCVYSLISNYDGIAANKKEQDEALGEEYTRKADTLYNLVGEMLTKNAFSNILLLPLRQSTTDEETYDEDLLLRLYMRRKYPLPLAIHALFGAARIVLNGEAPVKSIELYEKALTYFSKEYTEDEFLIEREFASSQLACIYALTGQADKGQILLKECMKRIASSIGTDNKFYSDIASYEGLVSTDSPNLAAAGLNMAGLTDADPSGKTPEQMKEELERLGFDVDSFTNMMENAMKSGGRNMDEKELFKMMAGAMSKSHSDKKSKADTESPQSSPSKSKHSSKKK